MMDVTWEWLGREPALDVADTIAVVDGVEHDLLAPPGEYERWAAAEAKSPELDRAQAGALVRARPRLLELRKPIRRLLAATGAGAPWPKAAVAELNRYSREAPGWLELAASGDVRRRELGNAADRLLATYARSAMEIAADGPARLRVCPAPSCGLFYRPGRSDQRWCSVVCGTRARVARHSARSSGAQRPGAR
jgi:predicted RNA-binding Zn ribbon-like protein